MRHLVRWMYVCVLAVVFCAEAYAQCGSIAIITPPSNGTVQRAENGSVVFKWAAVTGASSYDVYFGAVGQGCTAQPRATVNSPGWLAPPNQITNGAQYEWRVVANGMQQCQTPPSSGCSKFTVAACPTAPTLVSPAPQSQKAFGSITLQWSNSNPSAVHDYAVYIGLDDDPPSLHAVTTSTTKTITVQPGRLVSWYVVARANGCQDAASPVSSFTTTCPTTPATLLNPSRGATIAPTTPVNFSWTGTPGADGYDVEINTGGDWQILVENLTTTSYSKLLDPGQYDWRVRSNFDGSCDPLYSDVRSLTVSQGCNTAGAPELLSPARNATVNAPVTFEWTPRAGAIKYHLYTQGLNDRSPTLLASTTRSSHTATDLAGGSYEWWVIVDYDGCPSAESGHQLVTVGGGGDCPASPGRATLVAPAANATAASPITFQWNAVAGAKGYRVLVSYNGAEPIVLGTTTSTSLTTQAAAGSARWGVQTLFGDNCPTTLSDPRAITITASSCSTTPVQLVSPGNGTTVSTSPVEFKWSALPNAVQYLLFVATGTDDFKLYGETTNTSLSAIVPAGAVRWFVVARFDVCEPVRSAVLGFTMAAAPGECADATITLLTPADNSTATSPARFTWSAVAGASAYRVWASVNGNAPINVARTTNSTVAEVSLPAGTIVWYVEALRDGCDPIISNKARFTIATGTSCSTNPAPTLASPLGTRTAPAAVGERVRLVWNAVDRAIAYRVWTGRNGDAYSDLALTRETSIEVTLENGLYGWYVEALFEACNPVASDKSFFQVSGAAGQTCPTGSPVAISPAQGATTGGEVTFTWTGVAGAEKYRVYASVNGSEVKLIGTTEETSLERSLPPGTVVWAVEAAFEKCASTFSSRVQFTIEQSQSCPTAGTTLVAPANGAADVTAPVDFVWTPVTGALKYVLVVKVNDGSPTPITATADTHFEVEKLPAGTIEWWVTTYFSGCNPVDSAHNRFTIARTQSCDNKKPILLIPDRDATSPVQFQWTRVPRATGYKVWVAQGGTRASAIATTTDTKAETTMAEGTYEWYVEALFDGCPSTQSARAEFRVTAPPECGTPETPETRVVGQALSDTDYRVRWKRVANAGLYEVQESTTPDFANAQTFTTSDTSMQFRHQVTGTPVQYIYRVRAVSSCNDERSAYSNPVGVFVTAPRTNNASAEIGSESTIVQKVFLPGSATPLNFVATSDKPWLTIVPSSGALPAEGITLNVTADPTVLNLGTNTGTITVVYTSPSSLGSPSANATTTTKVPLSVSLVTPVLPTGKGTPPPDALIFPVVGHAQGANDSLFESDIRITNLTATTMKYDLHFTPSGTNGTQTGSTTTVEIGSGSTLALDDVVASVFGTGTVSSATGTLEVRPLTTSSNPAGTLFPGITESLIKQLETAASSRTYNYTPQGTFGQFIPATRFAEFVGKAAPGELAQVLSLQQVAQSSAYRANFGFTEASGASADMMVRVFDITGSLLATIPVSLGPGEHRQLNGMLQSNGINDLKDGRVEVEVIGGEGKITAYVSEVDNKTNDPLLVSPVVKGSLSSNRYVVPGTAFVNSGTFFWVSDIRIFNAGTNDTPATLTFYPMANPAGAVTRDVLISAGEIKVLDNVIGDLFGQPNGAAGMVTITTPTETQLTATARTYNKTTNGTYGQYIPGVTPAQSVGAADRALQLLQLEHSSRFRTNVGLAETSGQPATIEVSLTVPDSISTPLVTIPLAANEFRQISVGDFGLGSAIYNARVSVKVIEGNGRVTAYGSAIDQITQDPTYVPAQ